MSHYSGMQRYQHQPWHIKAMRWLRCRPFSVLCFCYYITKYRAWHAWLDCRGKHVDPMPISEQWGLWLGTAQHWMGHHYTAEEAFGDGWQGSGFLSLVADINSLTLSRTELVVGVNGLSDVRLEVTP